MKAIFRSPLSRRAMERGIPAFAVEFGFGFAFAVLSALLRWSLSPLMGDIAPFSFVFVAVAGAALLAGWQSGLWALLLGQAFVLIVLMDPSWSLQLSDPHARWAYLFSTAAELLMLALVALYQAEVRRAWAARERADQGRILLVRELNHRVKNTLAVVQSLASNTFRDVDPASVRAFEGRLQALASAHDLLTRQNWSDCSMADIIELATRPFRSIGESQIAYAGPLVGVGSQEAVTLVLALHELATNAAKYGALSTPEGRVTISWDVTADRAFSLIWQETGAPPVNEPARSGFGMRLVKSVLAKQFDAEVDVKFESGGLTCSIHGKLRTAGT